MDEWLDKREYDSLLEEMLAIKADNEGKMRNIEHDSRKTPPCKNGGRVDFFGG